MMIREEINVQRVQELYYHYWNEKLVPEKTNQINEDLAKQSKSKGAKTQINKIRDKKWSL
jgi:hypothetical protein